MTQTQLSGLERDYNLVGADRFCSDPKPFTEPSCRSAWPRGSVLLTGAGASREQRGDRTRTRTFLQNRSDGWPLTVDVDVVFGALVAVVSQLELAELNFHKLYLRGLKNKKNGDKMKLKTNFTFPPDWLLTLWKRWNHESVLFLTAIMRQQRDVM